MTSWNDFNNFIKDFYDPLPEESKPKFTKEIKELIKWREEIATIKVKDSIKRYIDFIDKNIVTIKQKIELYNAESCEEVELIDYLELELTSLRQMISNLNEI